MSGALLNIDLLVTSSRGPRPRPPRNARSSSLPVDLSTEIRLKLEDDDGGLPHTILANPPVEKRYYRL